MKVSWDDFSIPNMMGKVIIHSCSSHHQPVLLPLGVPKSPNKNDGIDGVLQGEDALALLLHLLGQTGRGRKKNAPVWGTSTIKGLWV